MWNKGGDLPIDGIDFLYLARNFIDLATQHLGLGSERSYFRSRLRFANCNFVLIANETIKNRNATGRLKPDGFDFGL